MQLRRDYLISIFILALIARLSFLIWGATFLYGENPFINNDSFSYRQSFINLVEHGTYSFDLTNGDASFGRLPGYPFFWGLHYLLFGDHADLATAITQIGLDSFACILATFIALRIFGRKSAALISGLVYALNPFAVLWVTVIGTESMATTVSILFFYVLLCQKDHRYYALILALLIALAFYTRPYLGIFLPISLGYIFFRNNTEKKWISIITVIGVFVIIYLPWPIRNYLISNELVLIKGNTPGYYRYSSDIVAARNWLHAWTTDTDYFLNQMTDPGLEPNFDSYQNLSFQKEAVLEAVNQGRKCGSGFHHWRYYKLPSVENCDEETVEMFNALKAEYQSQYPVRYWTDVPLRNVLKFFFKSDLSKHQSSLLLAGLKLRSLGILISLIGFAFLRKNSDAQWLVIFPAFMLIFLSFFFRQMEMRYMLQAEMILMTFSGMAIFTLYQKGREILASG